MGKLLETKLPVAYGEISPEIFNRLVRVLELSLNKKDVDATLTVNESQRNEGNENGVEGKSSLGTLSVATNGNTSISISGGASG